MESSPPTRPKSASLATRLILGFGVFIVLGAAQGLAALWFMDRIQSEMESLYAREMTVLQALGDTKSTSQRMHRAVLEHVLAGTPAAQSALRQEIEAYRERIGEEIRRYRAAHLSEEEKRLLATFETHFRRYADRIETQVLPLSTAGRKAEAKALALGVAGEEFRLARDATDDLMGHSVERGRARYQSALAAYGAARWTLLLVVALTALVGTAVALRLTRDVNRPLKRLVSYLDEIARGNLATRIEGERTREFGQVFAALGDTQAKLAHLREQERKRVLELETLAKAIDSLPHPVKVLSPDWTILSANPATEAVLGYTPRELVGYPAALLRYDTGAGSAQRMIEEATERGGWRGEVLDRHRDGHPVPVYSTTVPIYTDGRIRAILEIERDLTEEKERERKAIAAYRLAAVGELAAGVAHEVNNPLHAISSFAELLLAGGDLPVESRDDLRMILAEARRAGATVRNLLSFARQEVPEKRPVDLASVVQAVLTLKRNQLFLAGIVAELEVAPETPPVLADAHQLQQVVHNLVTNARQAMQRAFGHGTVHIRLRPSGEMVEMVVEDTGPGLSPEVLEHMFSPFFTTKEAGEGTGLGLSISYGIVQEHGGEIRAENWGRPAVHGGSAETGGTRITIRLPVAGGEVGADAARTPEREGMPPGQPRRVLVVEDEPTIASAVSRFLRRSGYRVETSLRAEEAIERLRTGNAFDVILSDLKMPGLGGAGLYRWIGENRPEMKKALLFTSGDIVTPETHRFLEDTGCSVLPKPYELMELRARLEEMFEN